MNGTNVQLSGARPHRQLGQLGRLQRQRRPLVRALRLPRLLRRPVRRHHLVTRFEQNQQLLALEHQGQRRLVRLRRLERLDRLQRQRRPLATWVLVPQQLN